MPPNHRNVQPLDMRPMDILRRLKSGVLRIRERSIKVNWWRGQVEAKETVTIVEDSHDART